MPDPEAKDRYQFGHTNLAAERLRIVGEVFWRPSSRFLREAAPAGPETAVDLGCGPGTTARLIRETLGPKRLIGLDFSDPFLAAARRELPAAEFLLHDVTQTPFPTPPAELIFSRFLLAHLPEPQRRVRDWASQLAPGGRLLVEEVEAIDARRETFRLYLETVTAMLAANGSELYVGPRLATASDPPGARRIFNRVLDFTVTNRDAARMFAANVPNWRDRPFIREQRTPQKLDRLQADFERERRREDDVSEIEWRLRQIAWERVG